MPYPLLHLSSQKYKPFNQTYGKETTNAKQPKSKLGRPKVDVDNQNLFATGVLSF